MPLQQTEFHHQACKLQLPHSSESSSLYTGVFYSHSNKMRLALEFDKAMTFTVVKEIIRLHRSHFRPMYTIIFYKKTDRAIK